MKPCEDEEIYAKIEELSVPMLDSIPPEAARNLKPYHQRYYTNKYCTSFSTETENNDFLLKFHSNRLILLYLADGHDIIREKRVIEKINFCVDGFDMKNINLSGKKKAGAKKLGKQSVLCHVKCEGVEKEYPIYTCVPASLIEINQMVVKNPQLLVTSNKEVGYLGVFFPQCHGRQVKAIDDMVSSLKFLSEDDYTSYLGEKDKQNGGGKVDKPLVIDG